MAWAWPGSGAPQGPGAAGADEQPQDGHVGNSSEGVRVGFAIMS